MRRKDGRQKKSTQDGRRRLKMAVEAVECFVMHLAVVAVVVVAASHLVEVGSGEEGVVGGLCPRYPPMRVGLLASLQLMGLAVLPLKVTVLVP